MSNIELFINQMNRVHINSSFIDDIKNELEEFLYDTNMNNINFVKNVMLSEEIKANNLVEGYFDDIESIESIIKSKKKASNIKEQRILNLYKGYRYILKREVINKENLKKLYNILSKNLLENNDLENMGDYYRTKPVYIFYSSDISKEPDEGVPSSDIDSYMNALFDFINDKNNINTITDYYIKSQIIHFYFVYIHPYFDVNGRTSRTMSMWYLLNNKSYPYIIFNRGINFDKSTYYRSIRETKKYGNITIFLKYMLKTVKLELEKEYLIIIIESLSQKLSLEERETLNYILSMKSDKNLKSFNAFYKRFNEHRNLKDIHELLLEPLFDKNILLKTGNTNSKIYNGEHNFNFEINKKYLDYDKSKIKRLTIN